MHAIAVPAVAVVFTLLGSLAIAGSIRLEGGPQGLTEVKEAPTTAGYTESEINPRGSNSGELGMATPRARRTARATPA